MNLIDAALHRIAADLNRHGHRWALVGGFAVSARSEPRFTRDVDVAVAVPNDDTAELVKLLARDDEHRPQDLADLRSLLASATPEDLELARSTVDLITKRGFHRGRDLATALTELLQ